MSTPQAMYAQSLEEAAQLIKDGGSKRTVLLEGHIGSGKSSILKMLSEDLPTHTAFYFDCNTKTDAGDIGLPRFEKIDADGYVTYVPNEELGFHLDGPIVLMVDEYGKSNKSVKNSVLRVFLERKYGNKDLHPDSIVFATTNMAAEGVGDMLQPHERNRLTVVRTRKSTNIEFIEYGLNHNFHPSVLGWANDTPQLFQSFEDVNDPEENPYIFHPQQQRAAFVTNRSLEAASDWLWASDKGGISNHSLTGALIGTIGARGAMDLMAFVALADQLPSLESIKDEPLIAKVPSSAAAICMVVFRTLGSIDKSWVDAWMTYMERLDTSAQGMFVNAVRNGKYKAQSIVMTNGKFTAWALKNKHLYSADKK